MPDPKDKQDVTEFVPPAEAPAGAPPEGYTADEWERLSPEEQEGIIDLLAYDPSKEGTIEESILKEVAGVEKTDTEKTAEAEAATAAQKVADDEAAAKATEETAKAGETKADEKETPAAAAVSTESVVVPDEDLLAYRPTVTAKDLDVKVEVPESVMQTHNDSLRELKEKRDAGDIDRDEYDDQRAALVQTLSDWKVEQRDRLKEERRDAVVWQKEQAAFSSARSDYRGERQADGTYKDTAKAAALRGALQTTMNQIEKDTPGLPGMQLLIKADRAVREMFGLPMVGKKAEAPAATATPAKKPPAVKDDIVTLGDLPAAGANTVGDGWAAVDNMPGPMREAWLAKQPEDVINAYLNGGRPAER